ncbi:MAG TPA: pitrilysin family protein [Burkholderiales bacterium]|nr:pitrilysin family protein [Burkholderiales bacterium]
MHPLLRWSAALFCAALLNFVPLQAGAAPAQNKTDADTAALPAGVERVHSLAGINEYRLANGLRVLLMPDPTRDQITVNITYLVGSRHEGYGERGMAHLLEHLLFKGTPKYPNPKGTLLKHGADFNGTTSYDRTNYFETFPADDKALAVMLDLEADRMVNARVSAEDLESEMTVVRNEFEAGENNPGVLLSQRISAAAYMWHNYGKTVIGTRSDIENVPIERLQAFYKRYYRPDNAVLIVAGRFDEARALDRIVRTFGKIPRPKTPVPATYTEEPPQDGEREVILRRVGDVQMVGALYHIPAGSHPDYVPVDLLTEVLTAKPTGRLHKALVETGQATFAYGYNRQLRDAASAYFGASVRLDGSLDQARQTLLRVLEGIADEPITDEEVERARIKLQNDVEMLLTNTRGVALTLSEFAAMGDWRLLFWYRDQLAKVTREDVQRVALAYLRPANRTVGLFYPTDDPQRVAIPGRPDPQQMLQDFEGGADIALGEVFEPTPENIESRVIRRTVEPGIKLAMLPKKTRGGTVVVQMGLHWGTPETRANRQTACSLASAMLARGTTQRTRAQLRDEMERLRATMNVGVESASISTIRDSLPGALALAAEMLRQPSFPEQEFEMLKREMITSLDVKRNDPSALASLTVNRHLNPYPPSHWNYTPTLAEQTKLIEATTLDDVRACHAELVGASHAEIAVVGDFDPDAVTAQVRELFAGFSNPGPYERVVNAYHDVTGITEVLQTPDKANAVLRGGFNLALTDTHADFPALLLGSWLIGGNSDARLARRVREQEGLSYGVGAWLNADALDPSARFNLYAIYAPQNGERVEAAIREELRKAIEQGFEQAEFDDGRQALLHARHVARNADSGLAGRLARYAYVGRTFEWDMQLEQRIAALTPAEVQDALRRHFDLSKLSIVKAGDFKAVATKP